MKNTKQQHTTTYLKQAVLWTTNSVVKLAIGSLIFLLPIVIVYKLTVWLIEKQILWLQWFVIVVFLIILGFLIRLFQSSGGSDGAFRRMRRLGVLLPLGISLNILFSYISVFAMIVFALPHDQFFLGVPNPSFGQVADFFMWHFFDMIPLLDFPETVFWKNPLAYIPLEEEPVSEGVHKIGWLLLAFKLFIIIPIIWLLKEYFNSKNVLSKNRKSLFQKQYKLSIDIAQITYKPEDRGKAVIKKVTPLINEIITDAVTVAIGTWPTPEKTK